MPISISKSMRKIPFCVAFYVSCLLVVSIGYPVAAWGTDIFRKTALFQKWEEIQPKLADTPFGIPIHIESLFPGHKIRCQVHGIMDQPFDDFEVVMTKSQNWSEMLLLHTNIKSCTVQRDGNGKKILTIYCGRKYYQPPEDTYSLALEFSVVDHQDDYFQAKLFGEKGPLFTHNYRVTLEGLSVSPGKTFICLSYEYDYGKTMKSALKMYYATLGRKKVGFTVVGTDKQGKPVFVRGNKGLIERNTVRFYFSVQAFMETLKYDDTIRFNKRIHHWYDLISQCPKQLYELSEKEYIENKKKEKRNQIQLQKELPR